MAAAAAATLAGCATAPAPVQQAQVHAAPLDDQGTVYGLFLAGREAEDRGHGRDAADYLARAATDRPQTQPLSEYAFIAALNIGEVHRAALLAPDIQDSPQAIQQLGRLTQAVDDIALGDGRDAEKTLAGDPFAPPHRAAGVLLQPWAAAAAGDWKQALVLPDAGGDRLIEQVSLLDNALLLEKNQRYDDADAAFRKLMTSTDGISLYTEAYGEFLERRGRVQDALELYGASLKGDPTNRDIQDARDRAAAGKPPPAAPTISEGAAQALLAPAAIYLAEKQSALGLAYLRLVLRLDPHREEAWLMVGDTMANEGDMNAAREAFAEIPPGSPGYVDARARLIETYQEPDDAATVLQLAQETVAAAPHDDDALALLAAALRGSQRYDESATVMDKVIADLGDRADWELYYERGAALAEGGHWPQAEQDMQKALQLKPDEPDVLNYLGYSWIDRGERLPEAKAMIEKALEVKPDSGAMVDSLGWAYYRMGDYHKAVEELEHAAELEPGDPDINNHLGDAYWRAGRRVEAEYQWRLVLTLQPDAKLRQEVEDKLKNGGPDGAIPPAAKPDAVAAR